MEEKTEKFFPVVFLKLGDDEKAVLFSKRERGSCRKKEKRFGEKGAIKSKSSS
jgi:hypothetical protein